MRKFYIFGMIFLFTLIILPSFNKDSAQDINVRNIFIRESVELHKMFWKIKDGICYCYSGNSKTTGFFVSKDGWILTAGHKVDKDFPEANLIHAKMTRLPDDKKVYKSTMIISPPYNQDLLLFKIDYKPKYYFKKFKKPNLFEENWIFGFRMSSGKVPSSPGYITHNKEYLGFVHTTATAISGNSGSPIINRRGEVLGVLVRGYSFGDSLFVSSVYIEEYIKENLNKKEEKKK